MNVSEFRQGYADERDFNVRDILGEINELLEAIWLRDKSGIREEASDVTAFVQCYLYDCWGIDGPLWNAGMPSYKKFMARRAVWRQLYAHAGIVSACRCCKNYKRKQKVIDELVRRGASEEVALAAYYAIVI